MTNQNKLSRREAIKVLGTAAGASLLANLPAKWSKPEVAGSVLPAFAQTSCTVNAASFTITPNEPFTINLTIYLNGSPAGNYLVPDEGLTLDFPCGSIGCLEVFINTISLAGGTITFSTFTSPSNPPKVFTSIGGVLLINLGTGINGTTVGPPVDGCLWGA